MIQRRKKVGVKVDQVGMPFSVPRLQSKLAYIWTTLKISAAAPRWHTHVHCRTHVKGTGSGRAAAPACQITTALTEDFTASLNAQKSGTSTVERFKRAILRKLRWLADAWQKFWLAKYKHPSPAGAWGPAED